MEDDWYFSHRNMIDLQRKVSQKNEWQWRRNLKLFFCSRNPSTTTCTDSRWSWRTSRSFHEIHWVREMVVIGIKHADLYLTFRQKKNRNHKWYGDVKPSMTIWCLHAVFSIGWLRSPSGMYKYGENPRRKIVPKILQAVRLSIYGPTGANFQMPS